MQAENTKNNIKVISFGCRLNALECEKIQKLLYPTFQTAILINTCAVTGEAERQSGQAVRKIARENPNVPIFVTGCAATRNPSLFSSISNCVVIHNTDKMKLDAYIGAWKSSGYEINTPEILKLRTNHENLSKQFIQIQNGCNHKCAYCVTRHLRGTGVSFDYNEILADAHVAVSNGFGEVVLTGVDIASYARDGRLISDVCRDLLDDVPGIQRLRLSSMDPASPEVFKIIDMIKSDTRMMPHMHLSMQSGSDAILKSMGRRHNADTVRKIVAAAGDCITFSWDIICGFPGESDELFNETLGLVRETHPIKIHAFPFSPRPDTVAATMPNQVNPCISRARVKQITDIADENHLTFMKKQIGKTVSVLVEANNIARDPHDIPLKITGDEIAPRTICDVQITGIDGDMFIGNAN